MPETSPLKHFEDFRCALCNPGMRRGGAVFYFPISPKSAQCLSKAKATDEFRAFIKRHIDQNSYRQIGTVKGDRHALNVSDPAGVSGRTQIRQVCVGLLFCLGKSARNMDVDNMAKAFLDSIKGSDGLISDDMEVVHLEVIKVSSNTYPFKFPSDAGPALLETQSMVGLRIINATSTLKF